MFNYLYRLRLLSLVLLSLGACSDPATKQKAGIYLDNAYIKRAVPGRSMTVAYAKIINHGPQEHCLEAFSSPIAEAIELHVTETSGDPGSGRVRMRRLPQLCLAPGTEAKLEPGGMHLMVMGLGELPAANSAADSPEGQETTIPIIFGTTEGRAFEATFKVLPFNHQPPAE